jgi:probable phosphoglycerate mutase
VASAAVPLGRATNNVAEYRALIAGLHEAAARGARRVSVRADSELVVRQLQGRYRVKAAHLAPLHDWARKLIARFDEVTFQSVPRDQNSEADRLAREGAERSQQAGAAPTDPPRHARRNRDPS